MDRTIYECYLDGTPVVWWDSMGLTYRMTSDLMRHILIGGVGHDGCKEQDTSVV